MARIVKCSNGFILNMEEWDDERQNWVASKSPKVYLTMDACIADLEMELR